MTAHHFHNQTLDRHGVDVTTDNGDRFGIVCPDADTARTLAAGPEAIRLLREVVSADIPPYLEQEIEQFLIKLHAQKC